MSMLYYLVLIVFGILFLIEILFRINYKKKHGHHYHVSIKFPWKKSFITPHPFLSFAYKKNSVIDINQRLPYPLHYYKYYSFKEPIKINNIGHFGDDFTLSRKENVVKIACLGDSVTANSYADEVKDYSYPMLLEEVLNSKIETSKSKTRFDVYNCGIPGWVSADIVIDFILNIIHTKPDYVILYHAFTDLHLYMTDSFELDYSHGRYNLGEVIHLVKRAYFFPKIPFWHSYEYLKDKIVGTGNLRNDLSTILRKQRVSSSYNHSLEVEKNLLKNICIICRHYGINLILSSYAFYSYKDDPLTRRICEGVQKENELLKELSEEFNIKFVDQANFIPHENEFFLDWIHLTPKGMELLSKKFAENILEDFLENYNNRNEFEKSIGKF